MTAPIGTITLFAGDLTNQSLTTQLEAAGWLPVQGQQLNRTSHPLLFTLVQRICQGPGGERATAVYQPNADSGTFLLPDLRGDFLRAADGLNFCGEALDHLTGRPTSAFNSNKTGAHTHVAIVPREWHESQIIHAVGHDMARATPNAPPLTQSAGNHSHTINGGGDAETRPRNLAVEYLIKVG